MQDIDRVVAHPVKNPEWITDDRNYTDLGALRDPRRGFGQTANAIDNIAQSAFDGCGDRRAGIGCIVGRDFVYVSECLTRIDEPHAQRNFAKAALISASVATSPPSTEALAASMTRNSSRVPTYSRACNSLSISWAMATSSSCASSPHGRTRSTRFLRSVAVLRRLY